MSRFRAYLSRRQRFKVVRVTLGGAKLYSNQVKVHGIINHFVFKSNMHSPPVQSCLRNCSIPSGSSRSNSPRLVVLRPEWYLPRTTQLGIYHRHCYRLRTGRCSYQELLLSRPGYRWQCSRRRLPRHQLASPRRRSYGRCRSLGLRACMLCHLTLGSRSCRRSAPQWRRLW